MSQFSRVRKNKELYSDLIQDNNTEIIEASLRDFERRTSRTKSEEEYIASRRNRNLENTVINDLHSISPVEEIIEVKEPLVVNEQVIKTNIDDSNETEIVDSNETIITKEHLLNDRDLLDDFIEEVKRYNINRGLRNVQDTQMNILQSLNNEDSNEVYNSTYEKEIEPLELDSVSELTHEIQMIIDNLDNEVDNDYEEEVESDEVDVFSFIPLDEKKDVELSSVFNEIETSALKISEIVNDTKVNDDEINIDSPVVSPDYKSNELLDLTNTLNLKLDLVDREVVDTKPQKTIVDHIINILLILVFAATLAIAIYGIWWVSKERGL